MPLFDSEGQALDGVSISDLKSGGLGGSSTNWKTLYEVKSENLGQSDKVASTPDFLHKAWEGYRRVHGETRVLTPAVGAVTLTWGCDPSMPWGLRITASMPQTVTKWLLRPEMLIPGLNKEKPDYFSSVATVVYLRKENCMYQACPTQDCNKKVIDQQNGLYRCEKCDTEFPSFKYRMILSALWSPR
ncbi:hypothetical protein P7K49_010315 [Saguinus oedipus]|uniref:Replication factor A C-terminal domain-containing protein n=1 Tax=Saguinus oedipus TaxID=9490 RepID=A0ABQ9VMI1_SAGOE|nr:hypothetical protein P7K49_010315 [Saguinus oedipus]